MFSCPNSFYAQLQHKLTYRKEQNLFRQRHTLDVRQGCLIEIDGKKLINFCSNDYLGLSHHPRVVAAFRDAANKFGVGSSASPLVSGRCYLHDQLEQAVANKTRQEAALVFSSGYLANLSVATSLTGRSDAVFLDRLAHASMIDAAQLSLAKSHRYAHTDPCALEQALKKSTANSKLVLTDALFGMDGDKAPLAALTAVCEKNQAVLAIDDAHGFGVLGANGGGLLEEQSITTVPIVVATFGKALGTAGAFVAADKVIIETLIQSGRSYIYTTALPPAIAAATLSALEVIQDEPWHRQRLNDLIQRFCAGSQSLNVRLLPSVTAIQVLVIGDSGKASHISKELMEKGFFISAIRPPTVPEGSARLRITLTATHTEDQIDGLLKALSRL